MEDRPDELAELVRTRHLPEAHAIRILLEEHGINVRIDNEMLQGAIGDLPGGWTTMPRVLVRSDELENALAFLEATPADSIPEEGACLACGEKMTESAACPACGWTFLGDTLEMSQVEIEQPSPIPPPTDAPQAEVSAAMPVAPTPRREIVFEILTLAAVAVIPQFLIALRSWLNPEDFQPLRSQLWDAIDSSGLSVCTIIVTLFLAHRTGLGLRRFGIDNIRWHDCLWIPVLLMVSGVASTLTPYFPDPRPTVAGDPLRSQDYLGFLVQEIFNGYAEEVALRGFLVTRLVELTGSRGIAVLAAALMFASYHIYQGAS